MIVIVGAGLAGLVCARCLAQAGARDFVLLEAEAEPGGRVRSRVTPEGFVLDRGFQVLLDSYPAVQRHLDLPALQPRYFDGGAILHDRDRVWTVTDPRRHPGDFSATVAGDMFPLGDKLRLGTLVAELFLNPDDDLLAGCASQTDVSTAHYLWSKGFSAAIIERFFRPFFGGVFLDEAFPRAPACSATTSRNLPRAGRSCPRRESAKSPGSSPRLCRRAPCA